MREELRKVDRAAVKAGAARQALEAAIREAHANGASLRKLAEASGLSHETVRKIIGSGWPDYTVS